MRQEVIVLEPDPQLRMVLRALLEADGYRVTESDPAKLQDVLHASKARTIVAPPDAHARARRALPRTAVESGAVARRVARREQACLGPCCRRR